MRLTGEISLNPTVSDVARLNEWLDQKLIESGIERSLGFDLKLCLNEIVANLISYGLVGISRPIVVVEIILEAGLAIGIVSDNGVYFDFRDWKPAEPRDLLNGRIGGFGIPLIMERANRIDYTRENGINRLVIVCKNTRP